jgi:cytoskeletal protein CcmA (bactofilin family)
VFRDNKKRGEVAAPEPAREAVSPAHEEQTNMTTPVQHATYDRPENLNALLGKGIEFEGKLSFEGTVRIDGTFSGQITTNDMLIIGEGARVTAEITCGSIVVRGDLNGNIRAKSSVELHAPGRVKGDISTPSLSIEKGVVFQGTTKMESLDAEVKSYERPAKGSYRANGPAASVTVAEAAAS